MVAIVHRIGIDSSRSRVYEALTTPEGLRGWWTDEVERHDADAAAALLFSFRTPGGELKGQMRMEIERQEPGRLVIWRCVAGPDEWLGTIIEFRLAEEDGKVIVQFAHRDWRELSEFTGHCSMKWATFLLSLRMYAETGTGAPSPGDMKIDNWN